MADQRPFAKIDVGYHWNKKWFEIDRALRLAMPDALPSALRAAVRTARDAHHASILYCRTHATDGIFPVQAIKMTCGIFDEEEEAALTALFEVGMWINKPGGMAEVRDYLEHQTDSATTKTRSEAARKAAKARWAKHAERNADRSADSNADRIAEERRGEERREELTPLPPNRFAEFWEAFPKERKAAKRQCATKYEAAVHSGVPEDRLIDAAIAYRDDPNRMPQFTAAPLTWLNQQRWEAGPLPAREESLAPKQRTAPVLVERPEPPQDASQQEFLAFKRAVAEVMGGGGTYEEAKAAGEAAINRTRMEKTA